VRMVAWADVHASQSQASIAALVDFDLLRTRRIVVPM
jgi:hypothetical protein